MAFWRPLVPESAEAVIEASNAVPRGRRFAVPECHSIQSPHTNARRCRDRAELLEPGGGEAANATSLDEVADSSWFENRIGATPLSIEQRTLGACKPEDVLPDEVAAGTWLVDSGKDNGSTLGFRVDVPDKGLYMLKADDAGVPERASAASVIGAALYNAAGFSTTCEQVVAIRRAQLTLTPGLTTTSNAGVVSPFDAAALDAVLAGSTQVAGGARMQASKWLPGLALGPFRYVGVRDDDPNDVIAHEDRRELRGSRLLAAWINHWDAREQNSMDLWIASDARNTRSSPGYVRHYILDTSDAIGGGITSRAATLRLGYAYLVSRLRSGSARHVRRRAETAGTMIARAATRARLTRCSGHAMVADQVEPEVHPERVAA